MDVNVVLVGVDGFDDDVGPMVGEFMEPCEQKFPDARI